tara:strand:- start:365 stop:496 length:132 start_codon:yes stop_codon:yes gene_type:complete
MKHLQQYVQAQITAFGKPVRLPNRQLEIGKTNLAKAKEQKKKG